MNSEVTTLLLGLYLTYHLGRRPGCACPLSTCGKILMTSLKDAYIQLFPSLDLIVSPCLFIFFAL